MKALQTQFDDKRLSNAVATPTCSSCCCCCCCLATSISSSSLLAQRIGKEGEKHQIPNRHLLTVLATLFVPVVGILVYLSYWIINSLLSKCSELSYEGSSTYTTDTFTSCTEPGFIILIPLSIAAAFIVLSYLYSRVHIIQPAKRAALVTALIAIAFTAEFIAGAALILTGVGGIVYLITVPVIIGWISVWYHRHIGKQVSNGANPSSSAASPLEQATKNNDKEPPQQNPPSQST